MDDREAQLDSLRIRQVAMLRRATYRSRSHAIIAAGVCAVAGVQLGILAFQAVRSGGQVSAVIGYSFGAAVAVGGMVWFIRRAIRLHHEVRSVEMSPPSTPPDFSTLRDGTDIVDRLNRIE